MSTRNCITALVLLFIVAGSSLVSKSYVVSDRYYFRDTVGTAKFVLIGRIVVTNKYDRSVPERESVLIVDEVLVGTVSVGDSLLVHWDADTWYPQKHVTASTACGSDSQLDGLQGVTALWLLNTSRGNRVPKGIRSSLGPYEISYENRAELERLLGLLENPKEEEQAALRAEKQGELYSEPKDAPQRRRRVVSSLKRWLKEVTNEVR